MATLAATQEPLPPFDLFNPVARDVLVYLETSSDLAIVGQTFGPGLPATYSASGNIGTLVIPPESHELMAADLFTPVPGSYTPVIVEFDLTTFEATTQPASGANASGPISEGFSQRALDTTALGGFIGPTAPPLFCTSQSQVDTLCSLVPSLCGQTCTIVPGNAYDPVTGLVNLIGIESVSGCDGSICSGPFDYFAARGDLMLTEAPASSGGGDRNGGACFIATAAYGSPLAGELDGLRAWRDQTLLSNAFGAAMTDVYYRVGSRAAEMLARHEWWRAGVRLMLTPIVRWAASCR
jgi:hypothetical protein